MSRIQLDSSSGGASPGAGAGGGIGYQGDLLGGWGFGRNWEVSFWKWDSCLRGGRVLDSVH